MPRRRRARVGGASGLLGHHGEQGVSVTHGEGLQKTSSCIRSCVERFPHRVDGRRHDVRSLGVTGPTKIGEPMIGAKLRSAVFLETLRDLKEKPVATVQPRQGLPLVPLRLSPDATARVTAHEILHTLTLIHDDAIICSGLNIQDTATNVALTEHGGTITDAQLNTMRGVKQPELGNDPNPHGGCPQR
jgi:hypothetical protein